MIPTVTNPLGTDYRQPLTLTALSAGSSVTLNATGSPVVSGLKYRTRSGSWQTYTPGTTVPLSAVGDYVQFWNTADQLSTGNSNYAQFAMTGTIAARGNTMSLMNFSKVTSQYCFISLFKNCSSLTRSPELPVSALATECYREMFSGCTSLTTAPSLQATTLANYCYFRMLEGCSSLTTAPDLPATTLAQYCYYAMFNGCTSLTTAPSLPATTLATNCYSWMFINCTSLTTAPELPAAILAPSCYYGMFNGCTSLTSMNVNFTDWNSSNNSTINWVSGVSASGTFSKPSALSEEYGANRIPSGWTIINK